MEGYMEDLGAPLDSWEMADLEPSITRLMLSFHNNNSFSSNLPSSSSLSSASHDHLVYGSASSSLVMVQKVRDISEDVINFVDQFLREALQNPRGRLSGY
ncbi:hypothetical protein LOK49_LG03G03581 [Camellia lanceoleosa]|uniref:Uncharacterized protein n=1 Tax=Camellia lanceoleosa TaxID=1840588 RepID=A0ACC0IDK7_9ERIC|nr:hypothetical protein LOK49_LG03G03581 [Camellia lanceoleosa]